MTHDIPDDATNSEVVNLIDEYVRLERDREILKDHWFRGLSFYEISEKHDLSLTAVKSIIYGKGDRILLKLTK